MATLLVAALPGTSKARTKAQMQVGFYDDPSFRWSPDAGANLDSAADRRRDDRASRLANWAQIAPTRPANASTATTRPTSSATSTSSSQTRRTRGLQLLVTITGTPVGERRAARRTTRRRTSPLLTQFAHMLAARYNGTSAGRASSRGGRSGTNRTSAVPGAAVPRQEDRQRADVREALSRGLPGHQGGQSERPGRRRRDVEPRPQPADRLGRQRHGRSGDVRPAGREGESAGSRSPPGRPTPIQRSTRSAPASGSRIRTSPCRQWRGSAPT